MSTFSQESFDDYVIRTHSTEIQSMRGKKAKVAGDREKWFIRHHEAMEENGAQSQNIFL